MNRELVSKLYTRAVGRCIEKEGILPSSLAWRWEEEFAKVVIDECITAVMGKNSEQAKLVYEHFGLSPND